MIETFGAVITFIGPLISMSVHVNFQIDLLIKALGAEITLELFLLMSLAMVNQN